MSICTKLRIKPASKVMRRRPSHFGRILSPLSEGIEGMTDKDVSDPLRRCMKTGSKRIEIIPSCVYI